MLNVIVHIHAISNTKITFIFKSFERTKEFV